MSDTSREAREIQTQIYREMSPEARLGVALELTATSRRLLRTGVRQRHPEYTDEQVRLATIRLWLGPDQFALAYPDQPTVDP